MPNELEVAIAAAIDLTIATWGALRSIEKLSGVPDELLGDFDLDALISEVAIGVDLNNAEDQARAVRHVAGCLEELKNRKEPNA